MLKRSKILVTLLVVAVLCASIGFAAASDTLKGSGTFTVDADNTELANQFDANVKFTAVSDNSVVTIGNDGEEEKNQSDTITIAVPDGKLAKEGDTYSVTATVSNLNKASANIAIGTVTNANSQYVTVEVTGANQIAGEGTAVYTITFTLVKAPSTDITNGAFSFEITATSVG